MTIKAQIPTETTPETGRQAAPRGRVATRQAPGVVAVLSTFSIVLPVIGILAPRAVVALLLVAALLATLLVWRAERRLPWPSGRIGLALGILLLWSVIASFWNFEPLRSLVLVARISCIFAAALLLQAILTKLERPARLYVGAWLAAGVTCGLGTLTLELMLNFPIVHALRGEAITTDQATTFLNRGASAMALLCWPAAAVLWLRGAKMAAVALIPATLIVLAFLNSLAAIAGVLGAALVVPIALAHRKAGRAVLVLATLGALLLSPLAGRQLYDMGWQEADWMPMSAAHRVEIWHFYAERIAEKPVLGWGFDAARQMRRLSDAKEASGRSPAGLHPHNAPLQILLELGAVGALISLGIAWVLIQGLEARAGAARIMGQATYVSGLVLVCTAYGVWQNQWLAMLAATALTLTLSAAPAGGSAPEGALSAPKPKV